MLSGRNLSTFTIASALAALVSIPASAQEAVAPPPAAPTVSKLLFPVVTNQKHHATGVAISNETYQSGACEITYQKAKLAPKQIVVPPMGFYRYTVRSRFPLLFRSFSGSAVANCDYPEAHGYAYIGKAPTSPPDRLATLNGFGYVAIRLQ